METDVRRGSLEEEVNLKYVAGSEKWKEKGKAPLVRSFGRSRGCGVEVHKREVYGICSGSSQFLVL